MREERARRRGKTGNICTKFCTQSRKRVAKRLPGLARRTCTAARSSGPRCRHTSRTCAHAVTNVLSPSTTSAVRDCSMPIAEGASTATGLWRSPSPARAWLRKGRLCNPDCRMASIAKASVVQVLKLRSGGRIHICETSGPTLESCTFREVIGGRANLARADQLCP